MSDTIVCHVSEPHDVYIGRTFGGFKDVGWGNPFPIGKSGTREEVIEKYRNLMLADPKLKDKLKEIKGKRVACWCRKSTDKNGVACHGDVLVELIEEFKI